MIPKPAGWMCLLDERILEHLQEVGVSWPRIMRPLVGVDASLGRLRERLFVLAHVEFVAPVVDPGHTNTPPEMWEIARRGREWLDGELDAKYYRPRPRANRHLRGRPMGTPYMGRSLRRRLNRGRI